MMVHRLFVSLLAIAAIVTSINVSAASNEPIQPIKAVKPENPDLVELGKMLFFDPRLSKSGFISCNSCHNLSMGGTDNIPTSIGHAWQKGPINSPTVLNATMHLAQFWDGRAKDLKEQAGGPIANPGEMASSHDSVVEILASIPQYRAHFEKAFGSDKVDIDRITDAIAAFEDTLVTPGSRFDKWLQGDKKALTKQEVEGYSLFKSSGCASCHNGPGVGGTLYQKFGIYGPYETESKIEGRKAVTGKESDLNFFKVPTLRNIELTYPYFHDGSVWTLEEAVTIMGKLQLDLDLDKKEVASIVAFLKTLTGEQPDIDLPILPPSTAKTPRPQAFE